MPGGQGITEFEDISATEIVTGNEAGYALMAQLQRRAFEPQGDKAWSATSFRQLIESPGVKAVIFNIRHLPFGFYIYRGVVDEAELISVAVDPEYQGKGFAVYILNHMVGQLSIVEIERLFLEVRQDNVKAVKLYTAFGFKKIGERHAYYQNKTGKRIDALVFSLDILNKADPENNIL